MAAGVGRKEPPAAVRALHAQVIQAMGADAAPAAKAAPAPSQAAGGSSLQGTVSIVLATAISSSAVNVAPVMMPLSSSTVAKMISDLLGTTSLQPVVLVGVGNLGLALLSYRGFEQEGFEIVAAFGNVHQRAGDGHLLDA